MADPARTKWWDDVVRADTVRLSDDVHLLWGDRVKVLDEDEANGRTRVYARGASGWVANEVLGGEPLLEIYVIDVGQGDGVLVVTPEGHHLMVDGGYRRAYQQTGKSAADFVDWKFYYDYLLGDERNDLEKSFIRLDAMIATHPDADHYGGLRDLIDREIEERADELNTAGVSVEAFYHPGLCPQEGGTDELGEKSEDDYFVQLLEDRASAEDGVKDDPEHGLEIRGWYRDFIQAVLAQKTAGEEPTPVSRLSHKTEFLPGFGPDDTTEVTIRVLAPIEADVGGVPGLRDLGDEGENKNGHSIALRLDYGERRILLTGDLNDKSQSDIIDHYGAEFEDTWRADVAKACHHGSHHIDYGFLKGVAALSTVFSSGDANNYDHPRAWVLGAAALAGRVIEDPEKPRLKAPLIYSTEIARSVALSSLDQLREYSEPQAYGQEVDDPIRTISGEVTTSKWRVILDRESDDARDAPPVPASRAMRNIIYGLVNVRTDGQRLLFAVRNERDYSWAFETIEAQEIDEAYTVRPNGD